MTCSSKVGRWICFLTAPRILVMASTSQQRRSSFMIQSGFVAVICQAGPPWRVNCLVPSWQLSFSRTERRHALPHQESNQSFATFGLLPRRSIPSYHLTYLHRSRCSHLLSVLIWTNAFFEGFFQNTFGLYK